MARKSKFSAAQVTYALKQVEAGVPMAEVWRKHCFPERHLENNAILFLPVGMRIPGSGQRCVVSRDSRGSAPVH